MLVRAAFLKTRLPLTVSANDRGARRTWMTFSPSRRMLPNSHFATKGGGTSCAICSIQTLRLPSLGNLDRSRALSSGRPKWRLPAGRSRQSIGSALQELQLRGIALSATPTLRFGLRKRLLAAGKRDSAHHIGRPCGFDQGLSPSNP